MPTLKERLQNALATLIPVQRRTIYSERFAPQLSVQTIDADRVHSVIEGAEDGDTRDLFALYREILLTDSHLQHEFGKRKLAVLGDVLSVAPKDKNNPDDVKAADAVRTVVESDEIWQTQVGPFSVMVNDFLSACVHLLDSTLWPVSVMEKVFKPSTKPGLRYELAELVPVPDQLLDFITGRLRIRQTDPQSGAIMGGFYDLDPSRYIVHRGHLLTTPDFRGGPMRSIVMWWMLRTFGRDWWARFLDKYGSPFLVGRYNQSDDASRRVLERAFQWAVKIGGLVVSKETEIEMQQATAASSGEAYEKFLEICNREESKLIIGQASSEQKSTGLGSGVSQQQENVREDIRQWDAKRLAQTLRAQLFRQFLDANGLVGSVPTLVWGAESIDAAKSTADVLSGLSQANIELTDEGIASLGERIGLPLQRSAAPTPPAFPGGGLPGETFGARRRSFSAGPGGRAQKALDANDAIAAEAAPALARAFRGSLAPVRRIISESQSAHECEERLRAYYADFEPGKMASLIEDALTAFTANGAQL